jgi:hypothetical protein
MLVKPLYKTKRHGFNSLRYQGAFMWNELTDDVKNLDFNAFRNYIRKWQPECNCGSCLLCTL